MPVVWKFHLRHEENFPGFPIPCVLGFTMFVLCYLDLFSHYIFCLKSTLFRKFTRDFPCLERAARNYRAKQMCKFQKGSHRETQEHERYFTHIACGIWEHSIQVGKISVPTKKTKPAPYMTLQHEKVRFSTFQPGGSKIQRHYLYDSMFLYGLVWTCGTPKMPWFIIIWSVYITCISWLYHIPYNYTALGRTHISCCWLYPQSHSDQVFTTMNVCWLHPFQLLFSPTCWWLNMVKSQCWWFNPDVPYSP